MKNSTLLHSNQFGILILFLLLNTGFPGSLKAQPNPDNTDIVRIPWINFGPYTKPGQNPNYGTIIPDDQIVSLIDALVPYVEGIRIFTPINEFAKIPFLAKQRGLKVIVGIWLGKDTIKNAEQIAKGIVVAKEGNTDRLIVGSEVLLRGDLTPTQLIGYINQVKQACPNIPVSCADVYYEFIAHPEVADACDFISPNIYSFWEGVAIECAISRFHQAYLSLLPIASGKEIFISESGWKSFGPKVLEAEPSLENEIRYDRELLSWSKATGIKVNIFSAFNEPWKGTDDGWGIFTNEAILKPGMEILFKKIEHIDSTWLCRGPDNTGNDTLSIDYLPVLGSFDNVKGHINHLVSCDFNIASYIKVGSGYWTKPTFQNPTVSIQCNSKWIVDYTTGGSDEMASDLCFFIVPSDYSPPLCGGCATIPQEVYVHALSWKCMHRYVLTSASVDASSIEVCEGDTSTLTAQGGLIYRWSTGEKTASIHVSPSSTTTYYVTISDGLGGGSIVNITVSVIASPNVSIQAFPDTIFSGEIASLEAIGDIGTSFIWSTGETSSQIEVAPLTTTVYSVTVMNTNGCTKTFFVTVVVNPVVSTAHISEINSLKIYPKPAKDLICIELKLKESTCIEFAIINSLGRTLDRRQEHSISGEIISQFDVSIYPSGIYFLVLKTEQGEYLTEKILIL
ncbi:MAG: T9SS type A sorting domain-containing protein [Saprospiraceae bacterium]